MAAAGEFTPATARILVPEFDLACPFSPPKKGKFEVAGVILKQRDKGISIDLAVPIGQAGCVLSLRDTTKEVLEGML